MFYAAREEAGAGATRFLAVMNADTLKELGREVAMGGVDAPLGLSAACEAAAAGTDGLTGIVLWDVEFALDRTVGDSQITIRPIPAAEGDLRSAP